MAKFQINILGCGSATSTLRHLPSSQVLNIRDNLFMIDCGEGAQLQMRRMKLKMMRLNHIFISHLHGDHCFGLPGLLSTLALLGKTGSLTIHIFNDGAEQFGNILNYFSRDMPYKVNFHIITVKKALIYEDDAITVTTIPLRHRIPSVGFLFAEKPKRRHINSEMAKFYNIPIFKMESLRSGEDYVTDNGEIIPNKVLTFDPDPAVSYAYCSDTMRSSRVVKAIEGVDWLYHESTFGDDLQAMAKKRYHSTARDAAIVARDAHVKHLILGNYSSRYDDNTVLLRQAQEVFPSTILSDEGMAIDLLK